MRDENSEFRKYFDEIEQIAVLLAPIGERIEALAMPDGVLDEIHDLGCARTLDFAVKEIGRAFRHIDKAEERLLTALAAARGAMLVEDEDESEQGYQKKIAAARLAARPDEQ